MNPGRRVIKVGGSLLDLPELRPRLVAWLADQTPQDAIVLVGGGVLADAIRRLDRLHGLDECSSHWRCIEAMTITAKVLHAMLPAAVWFDDWDQLNAPAIGMPPVYVADAMSLLQSAEREPQLPESWSVTSDSLSAWLAEEAQADELVLLKSCPAPAETLEQLAGAGYVDSFFPQAAGNLPAVQLVDFRDEPITQRRIVPGRRGSG